MDHGIRFDSDQRLAGMVREAFRQNSYRQLRLFHCRSYGGTVLLCGTAESFYIKQIAQTAAARVAGVQRVVNEIDVVG